MQYKEFSTMKPPKLRGNKDLIITLRRISDVVGCFYVFLCPENQKVKFALNFLRWGVKDWWEFMTHGFLHAE